MSPAKKKPKTRKKAAKKKKAPAKKKASQKSGSEVAVKAKPEVAPSKSSMLEPLAEIEKILDQLRHRDWFRPGTWDWPDLPSFDARIPSVDIIDRAKEVVVNAEVPGIDEKDLDVSVTDRTLTIKGETRHEEESEEGDMHRREIRSGSIHRSLTLPADVDGRKASATCKNGVLKVRLPKMRAEKKHSIRVG